MGNLHKIVFIIFVALLVSISYFTQRHQSLLLLSQYSILFGIYTLFSLQKKALTLKTIILAGIGFRLLFLLLEPNLSEDVYRFIWDGKMWLSGLNAYEWLPKEIFLQNKDWMSNLFTQINSPEYYTIYPPVNQVIFYLAALADSTTLSITIIRVFIIIAEIGTLFLIPKVLKQYQLSSKTLIWYAFNPLILIELTGNLHFEAFVIFFTLLSIYYFNSSKSVKSAIAMGLAIAFKLLPLILLAAYFRKTSLKKWVIYSAISFSVVTLSLFPLLFSDAIQGILNSSELYFKSFEFNASLYYLTRTIGYAIKGYNIIAFTGPLMGILSFTMIILFNLLARKTMVLPERMMWTWLIYCLFATTLHPWYCLPLLTLGILSGYKFPIWWTFLIFFTYIGYTTTGFSENLWVTFSEYILLLIFIVFEILNRSNPIANPKNIIHLT